jgi:ribokinase
MAIIVVGSIGIDFTALSDHLPEVGETVLSTRLHIGPGGKGFNQAVGARRLGGEVRFATKTGRGDLGRQARTFLTGEGLLGDLTLESAADNQVALILVDANGANMISVTPGASADLLPADLTGLDLSSDDILLAQLEIPAATVATAAAVAARVGCRFVLNPAPAATLGSELLELVDIATPNETELAALTGMPTATTSEVVAAAEQLISRGVGEVVATVGAKGAIHVTSASSMSHPALLVDAVDTTGAGDAFNAGLVVGLSRGLELPDAIDLGCRAGAYCVTQVGVLDGLPTQAKLDEFVARN